MIIVQRHGAPGDMPALEIVLQVGLCPGELSYADEGGECEAE